ncbi:hypothetical protein LX90_002169 [Lentzea flava]|nr:hypothetical protein [Lentzea flava]
MRGKVPADSLPPQVRVCLADCFPQVLDLCRVLLTLRLAVLGRQIGPVGHQLDLITRGGLLLRHGLVVEVPALPALRHP